MNWKVVDVQSFKNSNSYIFKEFAYSNADDATVIMFEPPFEWSLLSKADKKTNRYLTYHYHGLHWYDGNIPYRYLSSYLEAALRPNDSILLIKGAEKKHNLQKILPQANIVDLAEYGCPSLKKLSCAESCINHNLDNAKCAKRNVLMLTEWCKVNNFL